MVDKIKTHSEIGLYITEDQGGAVAANTPGEIDLDLVGTIGNEWIHFSNIQRFEEKATFNKETDFVGIKTWQTSEFGGVQASTGGARRLFFMITVETDETTAEYMKTFGMLNVKIGDTLKYLVKQTAAESFEQFSNLAGVSKKVSSVIVRGYNIVEIAQSGKDVKIINIALEHIDAR